MTRSTFVGSILGYVGGLGPHFCRGVPWSPDIVPYKTGEQPTTLNAQGDDSGTIHGMFIIAYQLIKCHSDLGF